jgi:hypothetical protein
MNTIPVRQRDAMAAEAQRGRPGSPLARYIKAAMRHEAYQQSTADQSWHGAIAGLSAIHSQAATRQASRTELQNELEAWLLRQLQGGLAVPPVDRVPLTEWIDIKRGW